MTNEKIADLRARVSAQAGEIERLREFERAHVENDQVYGQPMVSQRLADREAQAACEARNDAADCRRHLEQAETRLAAVRGAFERCSHKRHPDGTIYEAAYYMLYDEIKLALTPQGDSGSTGGDDGYGWRLDCEKCRHCVKRAEYECPDSADGETCFERATDSEGDDQ